MKALTTIVPGVLGLALLLVPGAAAAQDCMDCHSDKVDLKVLEGSPHKAKAGQSTTQQCLSCHAGIQATEDGHEKPAKVACGTCHGTQQAKSLASTHGRNEVGCSDCHGTHGIVAADPKNHRELKNTMCGKCHEQALTDYDKSFHGLSRSGQVATCVDCHGTHDILSATDPEASTYRLNLAALCAACHTRPDVAAFDDKERAMVKEYFSSAHGVAVSKGGLVAAATCEDCHGSHRIEQADSPESKVSRARIPETCGQCHVGVLKQYMDSVHGKPFREGNIDVPVCTDCHKSHQIRSHLDQKSSVYSTNVSPTCLKCHADERYVNRYSFPGLRGETYTESYHGAASRLGDPNVANCASCHTAHEILPSSDPRASTSPDNMAATCGQCHKVEDPSRPMAFGKIHLTLAEENHWLTGLVRNIYMVLIAGTLGFFAFYIVIDLRRRLFRKKDAAH